jgi:hypothetical protein
MGTLQTLAPLKHQHLTSMRTLQKLHLEKPGLLRCPFGLLRVAIVQVVLAVRPQTLHNLLMATSTAVLQRNLLWFPVLYLVPRPFMQKNPTSLCQLLMLLLIRPGKCWLILHGKVQLSLHGKVQVILHGKVQPILHGKVQPILHGKGLRREVRGSPRLTSASGEAVVTLRAAACTTRTKQGSNTKNFPFSTLRKFTVAPVIGRTRRRKRPCVAFWILILTIVYFCW